MIDDRRKRLGMRNLSTPFFKWNLGIGMNVNERLGCHGDTYNSINGDSWYLSVICICRDIIAFGLSTGDYEIYILKFCFYVLSEF